MLILKFFLKKQVYKNLYTNNIKAIKSKMSEIKKKQYKDKK